MPVFIDFVRQVGSFSLSGLWFPLLTWSVLSLGIWAILKCIKHREPLLQYHLRVVLVGTLPAGVALILATYLLSSESATLASSLQSAFITIPHPAPTEAIAATAGTIQPITWNSVTALLGTLTLGLGIISLLKLIRLLHSYKHLHQFVRNTKTYYLDELSDLSNKQNQVHASKVTVVFSALVDAPFTYTLGKPVIILPASLRGDRHTVHTILLHELIHIQRADFLLNGLLLIVKSLFWFHPLMHLLAREAETYREIACDAKLLSDDGVSKRRYARLLYRMASPPTLQHLPAVSLSPNYSLLKKRIAFMKTSKMNTWFSITKSATLSCILLIGISGFIGCTKLESPVTPSEESAIAPNNYLKVYIGETDLIKVYENESTLSDFDRTLKNIPDQQLKKLIISLKVHPNADYGLVTDVEQIMRKRGTMRINYATDHSDSEQQSSRLRE